MTYDLLFYLQQVDSDSDPPPVSKCSDLPMSAQPLQGPFSQDDGDGGVYVCVFMVASAHRATHVTHRQGRFL